MKKRHKKKASNGRDVLAFGAEADKMMGKTYPSLPDHSCTSALAILRRKRTQALQVLGNIDTAIAAIKAIR